MLAPVFDPDPDPETESEPEPEEPVFELESEPDPGFGELLAEERDTVPVFSEHFVLYERA